MFFQVEPASGVAIFDQVVRQVKFAVARGAIKPGNMVPSVRERPEDVPALVGHLFARLHEEVGERQITTNFD